MTGNMIDRMFFLGFSLLVGIILLCVLFDLRDRFLPRFVPNLPRFVKTLLKWWRLTVDEAKKFTV